MKYRYLDLEVSFELFNSLIFQSQTVTDIVSHAYLSGFSSDAGRCMWCQEPDLLNRCHGDQGSRHSRNDYQHVTINHVQ